MKWKRRFKGGKWVSGERELTEGDSKWSEKVNILEVELTELRVNLENEKIQNKELLEQLNAFEEDKQQFMLKIQELEEDNIRLMK
jgi:coenzyme F420-reducing hydrogenase delta subunit